MQTEDICLSRQTLTILPRISSVSYTHLDVYKRQLIACIIYDIINDEYHHRNDDRHTESSFTDNSAQWGTNEEEQQAGK